MSAGWARACGPAGALGKGLSVLGMEWIHNLTPGGGEMQVFEAIKSRYSVRSYLARPVEEDRLGRILEAARLAPSAANR